MLLAGLRGLLLLLRAAESKRILGLALSGSRTKWRTARLSSEWVRWSVLKGAVRALATRQLGPWLRLRLLRILLPALALLCEYRDEFPFVVLLTIVVDLNRFFIAVGSDSNDSAAGDGHATRSGDARYRAGLLPALLNRLAETGNLLLLASRGS